MSTCDECQDEINRWLDYHPRFRGYEVRAYGVERNAALTIEQYRMRSDDHWKLVRTQIASIKDACRRDAHHAA